MKRRTTWAIVLTMLFLFFLVSVGGLVGLFIYLSDDLGGGGGFNPMTARANKVLVFDWQGPLEEVYLYSGLDSLLMGEEPLTLWQMTQILRKAKDDPNIAGVVGKVGFLQAGLAKVQELRTALEEFEEEKPVILFSEMGSGSGLYLASAGTEFYMAPSGIFEVGLLAEPTFYKGTFDKIGIEADILHVGKYKAAGESFTRETMSDPNREETTALLDGFYSQITEGLAEGRNIPSASATLAYDQGLLTATAAMEFGLVDEALYGDQVWDRVGRQFGFNYQKVDPRQYYNNLGGGFGSTHGKVAVIFAEGTIMSGPSGSSPFGGKFIGSDSVVRLLRDIRESYEYDAVVLRVNSPGGSGLASDLIWREMELLQQANVYTVVSMSDVAASGGYYIAMGADRIVANPGTITGSIGVIAGKFSMRGLYDWAGVSKDQIKRGENATIFSTYQTFTDSERAVMVDHLDTFYDDFVAKAAAGREMEWDELHEAAQGRVWTGKDALDEGLIDRLGGLDDAIDEAKRLMGLKPSQKVEVVTYPRKKTFFESFAEPEREPTIQEVLPQELTDAMGKTVVLQKLSREGVMAVWVEGL